VVFVALIFADAFNSLSIPKHSNVVLLMLPSRDSVVNKTKTDSTSTPQKNCTKPYFNKTDTKEMSTKRILEVTFLFQDILNQDVNNNDNCDVEALQKKQQNLAQIIHAWAIQMSRTESVLSV
jgi:hypothetical protein